MMLLLSVSLLGSFLLFSHFLFHAPFLFSLDRTIEAFFESWATPQTVAIFRWITHLGEWKFLFPFLLCVCVFLLFLRRWKVALLLFLSNTLGMRLNAALKVFFGRERPDPFDPSDLPPSLAYPSGHAFGALIFFFLLVYTARVLWPKHPLKKPASLAAFVLIFLIGLSRVALGVHWTTDVIGGYLEGAFWITLTLWIGKKGGVWRAAR